MIQTQIPAFKISEYELELLPRNQRVLVANKVTESIRIVPANKLPKKHEYYNYFIFDLPASMQK